MKKSPKLWAFYKGVNVLVLASLVFYTSLIGVFFVPQVTQAQSRSDVLCTVESPNFNELDKVDIGDETSEFFHTPMPGWSEANIPGNYGGCASGAVCDYRQVIEHPCTEDERNASVILHAGSNIPHTLTIRHLDGSSLLDSFEVYINNQYIDTWNDIANCSTGEEWKDTPFDIFNFGFSGDLSIKLKAIDDLWLPPTGPSCLIYGQVAIDWISLNGCGDPWEPGCGDGYKTDIEDCDDGNNDDNDGCSATCLNEVCGDGIEQTSEDCDDGNNDNGDGCSDICTIEPETVPDLIIEPEPDEKAPEPELTVIKSVEEGTYYPGDSVNYIVTIENNGNETANDVRLDDTMPVGFTYDDGSGGSWLLGDLAANTEFNHIYSVTIGTDTVAGSYTNTAEVTADNHVPITAEADVTVTAKKGVVLGTAVVAGEEDELPQAGSNLREYLLWLVALIWMAFGAYGYRKLELKK